MTIQTQVFLEKKLLKPRSDVKLHGQSWFVEGTVDIIPVAPVNKGGKCCSAPLTVHFLHLLLLRDKKTILITLVRERKKERDPVLLYCTTVIVWGHPDRRFNTLVGPKVLRPSWKLINRTYINVLWIFLLLQRYYHWGISYFVSKSCATL